MWGNGCGIVVWFVFFFFKQKTAYEMRISDWSSDVCSSDLAPGPGGDQRHQQRGVDQDPRARDPGIAAVDRVLRGVADQPGRVAHLVHDVVAGVDAGVAGDALVLQAVADVDAGRAKLHADRGGDAVGQYLGRDRKRGGWGKGVGGRG